MSFVIEHRKHKYLCSKFAYVCKEKCLRWSAIDAQDVRLFKSEEHAYDFLDKKWLKYGAKVCEWKPVPVLKAKRFKEYFETKNVFERMFI